MSGMSGGEERGRAAGSARTSWPPPVTRLLAWAGILGPALFTVTFIALAQSRSGYSHVADPVSALAAGENGWIQNANFLVFGLLTIGFAVGLHLGIAPTRTGVVGPALLALSGVGLILAGLFPWMRDVSGEFSVPTGHVVGAVTTFLGAGLALIVLSRRMARDRRWRGGLATYTLASGIVVIVLFLLTSRLAVPDDAPLHEYVGLLQRATIAVWFPNMIVLATRLAVRRKATTSTG